MKLITYLLVILSSQLLFAGEPGAPIVIQPKQPIQQQPVYKEQSYKQPYQKPTYRQDTYRQTQARSAGYNRPRRYRSRGHNGFIEYDNNYQGNQGYQGDTYVESKDYTYKGEGYIAPAEQDYCNPKVNPHSFACHAQNFNDYHEFPLFDIDMYSLEGPWFAVTYANPSGNNGPEFYMDKNPRRPTQPRFGVLHRANGAQLGLMHIQGQTMNFENWHGRQMSSAPQSFHAQDRKTFQVQMDDGYATHAFVCRDFNRNNKHHLNCQWYEIVNGQNILKGYLGFIRKSVWDAFANRKR